MRLDSHAVAAETPMARFHEKPPKANEHPQCHRAPHDAVVAGQADVRPGRFAAPRLASGRDSPMRCSRRKAQLAGGFRVLYLDARHPLDGVTPG